MKHNEVCIFSLDKNHNVKTVYSFPQGTIRHIHNIIYDKGHNLFWVLTGDNEDKSGIYQASADWKKVNPIMVGEQKYSAVVGFPFRDGLLYATDSVEEDNFIYLLSLKDNLISQLCSINGSCIYGIENTTAFFFSTTVESKEGGGLLNLFSNKLGA